MRIYGEIAAFSAAWLWAICALCFTVAGHRVGSFAVNVLRLALAVGLFVLHGILIRGYAFPTDATMHAWIYLSISGFIGFVVGDLFLFKSFLLIGPRRSLLVMALWPTMAAFLGVLMLDEIMTLFDIAGMIVTLAGVAWVVSEQRPATPHEKHVHPGWGVSYAFIGAFCQALGLVLSKIGMYLPDDPTTQYDAFAATQIRALAGLAGFVVITLFLGRWKSIIAAYHDKRSMVLISIGAITGPFLGVALSLLAVQYTTTGVASTLMATAPVLVIPLVIISGHETVSSRAWLGAGVAVIGVAMLFLS